MSDEIASDGSLEQAAQAFEGLLSGKPPAEKPQAPAAAAKTPETPDDGADAGDEREAGPDDTDSDGADAKGSDNAPEHAAPSSMPEELKATFAKLPPDLQKFLVDRERDAAKGGAKAAGKASEERKAAEAERTRYATELQRAVQAMSQFRHPDIVAFESQFKDVIEGKTDLKALKDADPLGRFMDYGIAREKAARAWDQEQAMKAEYAKNQQETVARFREAENAKLRDAIPSLRDDKAWSAFDRDITKYVVENFVRHGDTAEKAAALLRQGSAAALEMAWKAMKHDQAIAKLKEVESKPVQNGKVLKPGNAERRNGQAERQAADLNRLRKSGRVEDAARLFDSMLSR